jgi:phospholipid/cholesterol/gamma-HCH transport system ATP-binding protein
LFTEVFAELRHVTFKRGERYIFKDVCIQVPRGKVTGIMGPSGCGKTTFLRLVGGQLAPDAGDVIVDGQTVNRMSRRALFRLRSRLGMLFQSGALFTDLSVFENVAFPLRVHTHLPEHMIRDLVLLKLEAVGLRGAAGLKPSELSGGMARRAALARAIVLDPGMIMYDEPFVGQDPITMGVLLRLIKDLNAALDITSVVVSHDVKETADIADYLYLLGDGQVLAQGEPEALMASDDPRVRQFMRGEADGPVPFRFPAEPLQDAFLGVGRAGL